MTTKDVKGRNSAPRETGSAEREAENVLESLRKAQTSKKLLKVALAFAGVFIAAMAIALAALIFGGGKAGDKNSVSNPASTPVVSVPGVGPIQKPATAVPTATSTVAPTIAPTSVPTTVPTVAKPTQVPTPASAGVGTGGCGTQLSPCLLSGTYTFGKDGPKGDPSKIQDGSYVLAGLLWLIAQNPAMTNSEPSSVLNEWPAASSKDAATIAYYLGFGHNPILKGVVIKRIVVSLVPNNKDVVAALVVYEDPYTHQEYDNRPSKYDPTGVGYKIQYVGGRWIVS